MPGIQTILHPTDFSENSRPAFETACALARDSHATLIVLHVMMPSVSPLTEGLPPDPLQPAESQDTHTRLPWPQPSDSQIRVEHRLAEGDAAEEVLRLSESLHCDVIVMGTHGRTGLGRLLTGSVAEEVLRKAACPVMVVRTPLRSTPVGESESIASPGEPISLRTIGRSPAKAGSRTLVRTDGAEVVHMIVPAGTEVPLCQDKREIIVQCLEGRVSFTAHGKPQVLEPGELVDLRTSEIHVVRGIDNASLVLTVLTPKT